MSFPLLHTGTIRGRVQILTKGLVSQQMENNIFSLRMVKGSEPGLQDGARAEKCRAGVGGFYQDEFWRIPGALQVQQVQVEQVQADQVQVEQVQVEQV